MSHDRGCPCGRERWDYENCPATNCYKKGVVGMGSIFDCRPENLEAERAYKDHVNDVAKRLAAREQIKKSAAKTADAVYRKKVKMSKDDWDFGFTTEDEIKSPDIKTTQDKLYGLRDMILPFLNNLKGDPDKNVIKWEGTKRITQINNFIDKMNQYIES